MKQGKLFLFGLSFLALAISGCVNQPSNNTPPAEPGTSNTSGTQTTENSDITSGESEQSIPGHTHTFSDEWNFDATHHWHDATCGHNVVDGKAEHQFGQWVIDRQPTEYATGSKHRDCSICEYHQIETIDKLDHTHNPGDPREENRVEPDCEHDGSYDIVTYCTICFEEISRDHHVIDKLGHNYGTPTYSWNEDNSTCTARRVCSRDPSHVETETVSSSADISIEPTYETEGHGTFTANFTNPAFETQIKETSISPKTHRYSDEWTIDENEHYHACVDEGFENLKGDRSAHTFIDKSAHPKYDCVSIKECSVCGYQKEGLNQGASYEQLNFTLKYSSYYEVSVKALANPVGTLIIPQSYNGYPVMFIKANGFSGCQGIKTLVLQGDSLTVDENAFKNCTGLETVIIGEGFAGFANKNAFDGCTSLKEFYALNFKDEGYSSYEGVLYDKNEAIMAPNVIENNGHINIKQNAKGIAANVFKYNLNLKSISFPDSLLKVGNYAFTHCDNLKTINFGNGIQEIGVDAFSSCASIIGAIEFPDSLTTLKDNAFKDDKGISRVTVGTGLSSVGYDVFYNCENLLTIVNKSSLNIVAGSSNYGYIAKYAIEVISDPSQSRLFEQNGFILGYEDTKLVLYKYLGSETNIELPSGVNKINKDAFRNSVIESVTCNAELEVIGESAFDSAKNLKNIQFNNGLKEILTYAFSGCSALLDFEIPSTVTTVRSGAFYGCSSLTYYHLPKTVTDYDEMVSSGCTGLKTLRISHQINDKKYISNFEYLNNIQNIIFDGDAKDICLAYGKFKSIEFGDGVETISGINSSNYAFDCTYTNSIKFSNTVKRIEHYSFTGYKLRYIELPESLEYFDSKAFYPTSTSGIDTVINHSSLDLSYIYYNAEIVSSFDDAQYVSFSSDGKYVYTKNRDNGNIILRAYFGNEETVVNSANFYSTGSYLFYRNDVKSVTFSGSISRFDYYTFSYCNDLIYVSLPKCYVSYWAFYNCPNLSEIHWNGTMAEFPEVHTEGISYWFSKASTIQRIICSDGTIERPV